MIEIDWSWLKCKPVGKGRDAERLRDVILSQSISCCFGVFFLSIMKET